MRVVLTGGPGAGKTTLLSELATRGYATVSESARGIIAERRARGESPRPAPETFAREILARDRAKYVASLAIEAPVFFDRSALEALAMLQDVAPMSAAQLQQQLAEFVFHRVVFLLPPWQAIYRTDEERDHSFGHAERVHGALQDWYRSCGYDVRELPRLSVAARAEYLLHDLGLREAAAN